MVDSSYERALKDAEKELSEVEKQLAALEQRKAQLEHAIANLRSLMGVATEERSLTDSIRMVLRATDEFLSVEDVSDKVDSFRSSPVNRVSVSTILNRLAKDKDAITGRTKIGRVGYKSWLSEVTPKPGLLIDVTKAGKRKR